MKIIQWSMISVLRYMMKGTMNEILIPWGIYHMVCWYCHAKLDQLTPFHVNSAYNEEEQDAVLAGDQCNAFTAWFSLAAMANYRVKVKFC